MQQSERRLAVTIGTHTEAPNVAVILMTHDGTVTWATAAAATVLGQPHDAIVGSNLRRLLGDETSVLAFDRLEERLPGAPVTVRVTARRPGGATASLVGTFEQLGDDAPLDGVLITLADVTATERLQDAYAHSLQHDRQTGLPTLALFADRLEHAAARHVRDGGTQAIVLAELDRFQELSSTHGVGVIDTMLEVVGARIATVVRSADTAARLGVDRFALLLEDYATLRDAELVAGRLQQVIRQPLTVGDRELALSMTCGIGMVDVSVPVPFGELGAQALRDAEAALVEARRLGPGKRVVARAELRDAARRRHEIDVALAGVLERDELALHYQPIVDLDTMTVGGVEALLRWQHPELGAVSPAEFLPLAESSGLIVPIGAWVLQEACRQVGHWNQRFPAEVPLHVAVNISGLQLTRGNLPRDVALAMAMSGTDEGALTLELTEAGLAGHGEVADRTLHELADLGVRLSLDDFGTGSSLELVQQFRFDEIKIERQFASVVGGPGEQLADALIHFGRSLGVTTVAEGIEDRTVLEQFRRLGCDRGQGYLLGRPAVGVEVEALLAARAGTVRSRQDVAPLAVSDDPLDQLLRDVAES